jgi:hypothetical protein
MGLLRAVRPWDRWIAGWGFDISKGDPDLDPELLLERSAPWWATRSWRWRSSAARCGT